MTQELVNLVSRRLPAKVLNALAERPAGVEIAHLINWHLERVPGWSKDPHVETEAFGDVVGRIPQLEPQLRDDLVDLFAEAAAVLDRAWVRIGHVELNMVRVYEEAKGELESVAHVRLDPKPSSEARAESALVHYSDSIIIHETSSLAEALLDNKVLRASSRGIDWSQLPMMFDDVVARIVNPDSQVQNCLMKWFVDEYLRQATLLRDKKTVARTLMEAASRSESAHWVWDHLAVEAKQLDPLSAE